MGVKSYTEYYIVHTDNNKALGSNYNTRGLDMPLDWAIIGLVMSYLGG